MMSKWFELKDEAISLRREGVSMTVIERQLGIPRSTLSGWFKSVEISKEQKILLEKNKQDGWAKARIRAVEVHHEKKTLRLLEARQAALVSLDKIVLTDEVLDLAFAMLYFGEGAKNNATSLSSSDPNILRFVITVLKRNYNIEPDSIRCDLHLRMDQDDEILKSYWSTELNLPITCFKYVVHDKRSINKPTYDHYKGVCVVGVGSIAIQRKLIFLYTLFCKKVELLNMGA